MPSKPTIPPLAKSAAPVAPTWDDVEPEEMPTTRDVLGLSKEDRAALGLTLAGMEMTHFHTGDANEALASVLATGGAIKKSAPKRK